MKSYRSEIHKGSLLVILIIIFTAALGYGQGLLEVKRSFFFFFLRFPFDSSNLKNSNQAAILNNHHLLSPVLVRGQSSNGQTSDFLDNIGYWAVVSITHSALNDPCQYTNNANQKIIQKSLFNLSILIYAYRIPTCLMILDFKTYPN